jgi:hypothetical protein
MKFCRVLTLLTMALEVSGLGNRDEKGITPP